MLKNRLFNLLAWSSLLLCVFSALLWINSYYYVLWLESDLKNSRQLCTGEICVEIQPGVVLASLQTLEAPLAFKNIKRLRYQVSLPMQTKIPAFSFRVEQDSGIAIQSWGRVREDIQDRPDVESTMCLGVPPGRNETITFPLWLPTSLFGTVFLACVIRWQRLHKRLAAGHCQVCGYDLRATPDRCPECGAIPHAASIAASQADTQRSA